MRVWFVNQYAAPPDVAGPTRHYSTAKTLLARGHEPVIVASAFDHVTRRQGRLHKGEPFRLQRSEGVDFFWIRTPPYTGNSPARVRNMLDFAWKIWPAGILDSLARPDVVVGSSPHPFAALAAERMARRFDVPFVMEVRDLWPESLIELGGYGRWHPFIAALSGIERYLYRHAHSIVTVLPLAAEHIVRRGGRADRIHHIPNGVDFTMFPPPAPARRGPEWICMYAGTYGLANRIDSILDCAGILRDDPLGSDVRFVFVGDGPQKPRLLKRAADERLHNVRFDDPVPKRDLAAKLATADLFLIALADTPLYRWGLSPNKVWESMAAGRPLLFAARSPFDPVAEAGCGFTIDPGHPAELAEALRAMLRLSDQERAEMGCRGRSYVERHHDVAVLSRRYQELLERIVSS